MLSPTLPMKNCWLPHPLSLSCHLSYITAIILCQCPDFFVHIALSRFKYQICTKLYCFFKTLHCMPRTTAVFTRVVGLFAATKKPEGRSFDAFGFSITILFFSLHYFDPSQPTSVFHTLFLLLQQGHFNPVPGIVKLIFQELLHHFFFSGKFHICL